MPSAWTRRTRSRPSASASCSTTPRRSTSTATRSAGSRWPHASASKELTDQWGSELVGGWHEWIDLPERVGDLLATGVLGARPGEVIVADSTTVNLFKLAGAVLDTRAGAIVTDAENFPTDRYVLDGLARLHGRELRVFDTDPVDGPQPEDVERACAGADVALVVLSHVAYRSGALADIEQINRAAAPAPVLWDLSHSAGAVPSSSSAEA